MLPPPELGKFLAWCSDFQLRVAAASGRLLAEPLEIDAEPSMDDPLEARIQPRLDARRLAVEGGLAQLREVGLMGFGDELSAAITGLPETVALRDEATSEVALRRWFELEFVDRAHAAVARLQDSVLAALEDLLARLGEADRTLDYYALAVQRHEAEADDLAAAEFTNTGTSRLDSLIAAFDRRRQDQARRVRFGFLTEIGAVLERSTAPYRAHRPELIELGLAAHESRRHRSEPRLLDRGIAKLQSGLPIARQLLGEVRDLITSDVPTDDRELTELLGGEPAELGRELPLAYRRLFTTAPLEIADLYVRRPALERACIDALEAWGAGLPQVVLVHGDRGSGKRTLVNQVLTGIRNRARVRWVRLGPGLRETGDVARVLARALGSMDVPEQFADLVSTPDDLAEDPEASRRRSVIVVENAERLLAPSADGVARMQEFMAMVARSTPATLWILVMATPGAEMALHRLGLARRIPTVVEVDPLERGELQAMLMARQRLSGFELSFTEAPSTLLGRVTTLRSKSASDVFHARLHEASGGNPRQALFVWLARARIDAERPGTIVLAPLPAASRALLGERPLSQRLILALLAQHGSLSSAELVEALAQPHSDVEGDVHVLWARGLLAPSREQTRHWTLRSTLAHPVARELRALNMI